VNTIFRSIRLASVLLVLPVLALACESGHDNAHDSKDAAMHDEHGESHSYWFGQPGDAARASRTIRIIAEDIRFEPAAITVRVGETIAFEIVNQGQLEHEFVLADATAQAEHEKEMQEMARAMPGMSMDHRDPNAVSVKAGETKTLPWVFTKAGTLQYGCHVPGHFQAGMVGQVTVTE
jgi:uncharacterized cupredoxin-like copper-binding protein